jgi:hypothetical protein
MWEVRMSGLDWNVELRKIEREYDGLAPEPSPAALNAKRASERLAQLRQDAQAAAFGAWARLLLVAALASALGFWPYARECGAGLFAYMAAEALIVAGALWVVTWTWRWRMVKTHGLALMMVLYALALIGAQVAPRVGYAKVDAAHPQQWWCAAATSR